MSGIEYMRSASRSSPIPKAQPAESLIPAMQIHMIKKYTSTISISINDYKTGLGTEIKMNIDINFGITNIQVSNIDISFGITEIQVINNDINLGISKIGFNELF